MNLNIKDYDIDDLISLYQLEPPFTNENIQQKTNEFLSKHTDSQIQTFFNLANNKLIKSLESTNNVFDKVIYINSAFRKNNVYNGTYSLLSPGNVLTYSESDFTFSLTESMKNVESISLLSIELPYTWYNIDSAYFNNFFWIDDVPVTVPSGHYTIDSLIVAIIDAINIKLADSPLDISCEPCTLKTKIENTSPDNIIIEFHKNNLTWRNYNLGWILGFRDKEYTLNASQSINSEELANLTNVQYFFVLLDDYNNNKISTNLSTLYDEESSLTIPDYFSNNLDPSGLNVDNIVQYNQGIPRQITIAQQHTLNEILLQRHKPTEKLKFSVSSDVLAIIPINTTNLVFGQSSFSYVDTNSVIRNYCGKVNIDRMRVRLINDRGQLVNLNGANWSFVLKSTHG
tara:strand:+ start:1733 stop:2932 length:1200 start_codon:yes stop_codon:yes gene_type:complete